MRKWKLITHCIILATTPSLFAYPQYNLPHVTFQMMNYGYHQETEEWVRPNTYDGIIQMLEDLESGELERRYSLMQLTKMNDYLAILAILNQKKNLLLFSQLLKKRHLLLMRTKLP